MRGRQRVGKPKAADQRVFHELEVHQIELELQNAELHDARNALEAAVESYTALYDFAPVGYFSIDEFGVILEANLTGATLLGVERSRLINRRLPLFVSPTSRPAFLAFLKGVFTGLEDQICEALLLKDGGGSFWADFRATPAASVEGGRKWCRVAFGDITARKETEQGQQRLAILTDANLELRQEIVRRKKAERTLQNSFKKSDLMQEKLRRMAHRILQLQEEERKSISRELHDEIAQTLVGINVRLATLTQGIKGIPRGFQKKVERTQRLVEESVEIVQRFARDLRPPVLDDLGLAAALATLVKEFKTRTGVRAHLKAADTAQQLSPDERTALYRVAHEALTNVTRHAQATRVDVSIQKLPHATCMTISDDGRGFRVPRALQTVGNKHLGLLGMRERLEMVGGRLDIASAPGKGTTITATIKVGEVRKPGRSRIKSKVVRKV